MPDRMRAFVAVTDNDWFRFLSAQEGLDEVTFWQSAGGTLRFNAGPFSAGT